MRNGGTQRRRENNLRDSEPDRAAEVLDEEEGAHRDGDLGCRDGALHGDEGHCACAASA